MKTFLSTLIATIALAPQVNSAPVPPPTVEFVNLESNDTISPQFTVVCAALNTDTVWVDAYDTNNNWIDGGWAFVSGGIAMADLDIPPQTGVKIVAFVTQGGVPVDTQVCTGITVANP